MVENFEAIKNLTQEDVDFSKRILRFFELIGVKEEDIKLLVELAREKEKIIKNVNSIAKDQEVINSKLATISKSFEDLKNRESGKLNVTKYDPIAELNKSPISFKKGF